MSYHGDIRLGDTIDIKFTTRSFSTGAPTQLAGTPAVSAYVGNSTTQITAGITLSVDFDTVTGLNNVRVVATGGNGYATASNYTLVITTGTVGGVSVVGEVIGEFSIEARSALMPTTAARTLDVSAGGEAGVDWANIGSPTTAQNLSGTNIDVDQVVASVSGAVGSVTGAVGSVTGLTNASIADAVWDEDATAHQTQGTFGQAIGDPGADANTIYQSVVTDAAGANIAADIIAVKAETASIQADTNDIQTRLPAALVGGRMDSSVGAAAANVITASALAADAVSEIADQVWEEAIADHSGTAGSTAEKLAAAGAAGDPWATALPGAYGAGTAGKIVGDNVNATISSRATQASVDTVDTNVDSILADTGTDGVVVAAASKTGYALSSAGITAIWDEVMEGAVSAVQMMRGFASALMGKASGLATTSAVYRDIGDTKDRITATVDADGNRTAVTRDLT